MTLIMVLFALMILCAGFCIGLAIMFMVEGSVAKRHRSTRRSFWPWRDMPSRRD